MYSKSWLLALILLLMSAALTSAASTEKQLSRSEILIIQKTIKHYWYPPEKGFDLPVSIGVRVRNKGKTIKSVLLKTSGNHLSDTAALHAVSSALTGDCKARMMLKKEKDLDLVVYFDWGKEPNGIGVKEADFSR
ncbi:MAG: hypothetical protein HY986_11270 [Candidatus Melainabacteria bacterium]|nr:hypothetical protein [Candidatus Melainabacteria bacterium]